MSNIFDSILMLQPLPSKPGSLHLACRNKMQAADRPGRLRLTALWATLHRASAQARNVLFQATHHFRRRTHLENVKVADHAFFDTLRHVVVEVVMAVLDTAQSMTEQIGPVIRRYLQRRQPGFDRAPQIPHVKVFDDQTLHVQFGFDGTQQLGDGPKSPFLAKTTGKYSFNVCTSRSATGVHWVARS